ncbi:hypothetical protein CQA53_02430 [Helicobacter didelphidarum]|uniref:Uncharacterized protein n=1 Tax=Helicobacter didelphidarum TaxID=2040648 RepID=A0A3D8IPA4_9HELI|nr:hypothetical protein [Helicobacter didelphidarum]RDU67127.1 hypothetical protein CQA53_02430 [Helicobacter didelphidarum]
MSKKIRKIFGITKEIITKQKGLYICTRHLYRICGLPIFFRDNRESYRIHTFSPHLMVIQIAEYIVKSPDIAEKIYNLTRGVDSKQANNIIRVIKRLQQMYLHPHHTIQIDSLNNKEELEQIQKVRQFGNDILEITPPPPQYK